MAPLPVTNTARLFIEYRSLNQEHVAQLRLINGSTLTDAQTLYGVFAPLMAALLFTSDAVTGARFSAQGSNLSFPIAVSPVTGTVGGTGDEDNRPEFISFTGRGLLGRRVRFTLFTPMQDPDTVGYRQTTPGGAYGAILDALNANTPPIVDISNNLPVWNAYQNAGYNAYFQRKRRRG